ncbi:hypothetical protein CLI92_00290 [Vandammella animalimorsus]|uniref:DUF4260 family protein n=3 Tax=Vandammella animalimorsus TaxID=2029117 RepID=A0A2A2T8D4_9BURK|nr:hypothetical protein CLI92_00290 [Vandammella animalimorsus]PAX20490.1 hypothetical protein CLI93_01710 [Vandammella animalimorsus]
MGGRSRFCEASAMRIPLAREENFDMQEIRGAQYAVAPPITAWLRWEALTGLLLALGLYAHMDFAWGKFALYFLLPDVALLAYLFCNAHYAAWLYNLTHNTIGAALLGVMALAWNMPVLLQASLIWFAHACFDRALGYGLKYGLGFHVTHLGVIGLRGLGKKRAQEERA